MSISKGIRLEGFFAVQFDQLLSFALSTFSNQCAVDELSNTMIKFNAIKFTETPGIEPRAVGCETLTLPLCYAIPPAL